METLFIYLLKASALLAVYFIAYHFLLRKETFFTTNRWFLLAGMITSGVMPLLFIKKIVLVERPKVAFNELTPYSNYSTLPVEEVATIDWFQITAIGYTLISVVLFVKILTHLVSLFKLLHKKEVVKKERFSLVDLNEDIAPFSFFNYIVYNSSYYTNDELHSILLHEKIHSREKHSIDVMLAKLFCIVFWFNPFMWLYKKAITQNLEYIADQKAIQHIEDKKVYQKALLKVVTHQNYLSITSHFYQSLIKKRIVMLNKNQSKKSNSWKYALVLPVLIAFVIFFQVKVIAQEKSSPITESRNKEVVKVVIDKNTSDQEMKKDAELLKKDYGVTLTTSKVKRNSKGEITAINVTFNDHKGSNGTHVIDGDEPISPIMFSLKRDKNGKGQIGFYDMSYNSEDEVDGITEVADVDFPTPPIPPTPPVHPYQDMMDAPNAPALPEFPEAPEFPSDINNEKAMAQYEKSMVTFERKMKKAEKEFESKMEVFERNMNENDPKMKTFEREMEKFEVEMERFQDQLEDRLERDIEIRVEKNINKDGKISQKHMRKAQKEAMKAREEATEAREEATRDREEAMRDREEAMRDREEANKIRKEIRKEVRKTE